MSRPSSSALTRTSCPTVTVSLASAPAASLAPAASSASAALGPSSPTTTPASCTWEGVRKVLRKGPPQPWGRPKPVAQEGRWGAVSRQAGRPSSPRRPAPPRRVAHGQLHCGQRASARHVCCRPAASTDSTAWAVTQVAGGGDLATSEVGNEGLRRHRSSKALESCRAASAASRGVPSVSRRLWSACACSRQRTQPTRPIFAAQCSGLVPPLSTRAGDAPLARSRATTSEWPP